MGYICISHICEKNKYLLIINYEFEWFSLVFMFYKEV